MSHLSTWVRTVALCIVMAGVLATVAPKPADARVVEKQRYDLWEYQHFIGKRLEWCGVKTNWPKNKMVLTIRLLPNRLDYFFYNRDWNLRRQRKMEDTIFIIGGKDFSARTETLDSDRALFGTFDSGVADFVRSLKAAKRLKIEFPTDQSIGVNLNGASRAIDDAIRCWNRHLND